MEVLPLGFFVLLVQFLAHRDTIAFVVLQMIRNFAQIARKALVLLRFRRFFALNCQKSGGARALYG